MCRTVIDAFVVAALFAGTQCTADIVTFTGDDTVDPQDWHRADNWDIGVPTADDRAVIPFDFHVEIRTSDVTVDTIEIEEDASLTVSKDRKLTLRNRKQNLNSPLDPQPGVPCPIPQDNSIIDGALVLESDSGEGATLRFVNCRHHVAGVGVIFSTHSAPTATIHIDGNLTLVNRLATHGIFGSMTITGSGVFRNEGIVEAGPETHVEIAVSDAEGALWISTCKTNLYFHAGSLTLAGDFSADSENGWLSGPGHFVFKEPVRTCGTYRSRCGGITLDGQNVYFEYADYEDLTNGSCPNPASGGTGGCQDPWIIDSDISTPQCG